MITFQEDDWETFWRDGQPIFPRHWRELALDRAEIPMDLDYEQYSVLGQRGMMMIVTIRDTGRLIGYAVMFLLRHFHYKSSGLMAMADMYYLLPEYRKGFTGIQLFREVEKRLRERRVSRVFFGCKVHQDHQPLFEALGYRFADKQFSKLLI